MSGFDRCSSDGDEIVGFPGAGRSDETGVVGSSDPVEGDEMVVVAGGVDDSASLDWSRVFSTINWRLHPAAGVGLVPGDHLLCFGVNRSLWRHCGSRPV